MLPLLPSFTRFRLLLLSVLSLAVSHAPLAQPRTATPAGRQTPSSASSQADLLVQQMHRLTDTRAIEFGDKVGNLGIAAMPAVRRYAASEDVAERIVAMTAAGHLGDSGRVLLPLLREALSAPPAASEMQVLRVRSAARSAKALNATALGALVVNRLGFDTTWNPGAHEHTAELVRAAVLAGSSAVPVLMTVNKLYPNDETIQHALAEALPTFGAATVSVATTWLGRVDDVRVLPRWGMAVVPAMREIALTSPDIRRRVSATFVIGQIKDAAVIPVLAQIASSVTACPAPKGGINDDTCRTRVIGQAARGLEKFGARAASAAAILQRFTDIDEGVALDGDAVRRALRAIRGG